MENVVEARFGVWGPRGFRCGLRGMLVGQGGGVKC